MKRGYPDLHEHLEALKQRGLLLTIDRPIDKDAELHPLVRWQFVGGLPEEERKAFLFTNITDGRGRRYAMPWSSAPSPPTARSTAWAWACRSTRSRRDGIGPSPTPCRRGS
jgi:hypothetical protein